MTPRTDRNDITDPADIADSSDSTENDDPMLNADAKDPTDPTDKAEPTDPMDRTDPRDPIDRRESCDHRDHFDDGFMVPFSYGGSSAQRGHPGARLPCVTGCAGAVACWPAAGRRRVAACAARVSVHGQRAPIGGEVSLSHLCKS
jgi:hypothetical protein